MMNRLVTLDARLLQGGVGTYVRNVLQGLTGNGNSLRARAIVRSRDTEQIRPLCDQVSVLDVPIYTLREQIEIPRAARGCDLLHIPHYNAPAFYRGKMVVTIHDLTHLEEPSFRRNWAMQAYARTLLHCATRNAAQIITVSEYSKSRIVQRLRVAPEKVTVILNGVAPGFAPVDHTEARAVVVRALSLSRPYLLFVGNLKPHKNLHRLIRAFALLRARGAVDQKLLLVGDDKR